MMERCGEIIELWIHLKDGTVDTCLGIDGQQLTAVGSFPRREDIETGRSGDIDRQDSSFTDGGDTIAWCMTDHHLSNF